MHGEFRLRLKDYHEQHIIQVFEKAYGKKLQAAYDSSDLAKRDKLKGLNFYAGYHTDDSLFLVYTSGRSSES